MKKTLLAVAMLFVLGSCASKKKMTAAVNKANEIQIQLDKARADLNDCDSRTASLNNDIKLKNDELTAKNHKVKELEDQLDFLKKNNNSLLDRMSDLSVISKEGSESIKKSLEMMNVQGGQIRDLNASIQRKDSLNMALVLNLKRSLADVSDEDVQIEVKKGVVYVSLSDKMLFKSGSSVINSQAETVLAKVAKILNDYKEIEILIEGHTDNVPIATDKVADNWDLSVLRATSVARTLQKKYGVEPVRLIAGGRGEYLPKAANDSPANRSLNRRTEIIITPKLDQFFNLYTPNAGK
ncbi:OmpA family protein [Dyadobacter sp. LHD-138]|uniref:OmpA family protein n=1 Tax=Dyadobacter sp. LHD-138 TaxID=3071413 RepID=UPI0027DED983|nr:OmpA family protein [Dyadobacter sp. LHD-138]MDQ6480742.1 OmpA family protein [Dyadobacter sp. LHD-138]